MESTLNQILEKLTYIQSELDTIKTNMATKEDLSTIQQAVLETNNIVKSIELIG
ncbi:MULTISPECIES: hypothetical protein [Parageobacillus]|uniref:hypothetical protein n=1 Tax=Parageobacillus TaxID=1906945 RepID=UPI000AF28ACC|nr:MULTISPECIES: hypothetical protein [Parageobacillus]BDG48683.1 hypothetical protein PspKH34_32440 [Parageobacillus sp. KH3-4]